MQITCAIMESIVLSQKLSEYSDTFSFSMTLIDEG